MGKNNDQKDAGSGNGKKGIVRSVLEILRDIAIAALIIVLIMGILYAYSGVWPPPVVIESQSMSHDAPGERSGIPSSQLGVIDGGDMVIVKKMGSIGEIRTYAQCQERDILYADGTGHITSVKAIGGHLGYETYGSYGDVVIYQPPTDVRHNPTPVIHRAVLRVELNSTTKTSFDVPELGVRNSLGTIIFPTYGYNLANTTVNLNAIMDNFRILKFTLDTTFTKYMSEGSINSSLRSAFYSHQTPISAGAQVTKTDTMRWDIADTDSGKTYEIESIGTALFVFQKNAQRYPHGGYITMGDHNVVGTGAANDQERGICSQPVEFGWVIGVARGELPWFGAIKLWFGGNTVGVPQNTWSYLFASIVLIILVPVILDIIIDYSRRKRRELKELDRWKDTTGEDGEEKQVANPVTAEPKKSDGHDKTEGDIKNAVSDGHSTLKKQGPRSG
jgi:signal peptidase I